jgi:hypothetical protein
VLKSEIDDSVEIGSRHTCGGAARAICVRKSERMNVVGKIIVKEKDCRNHWVESDEELRGKHGHSYMRIRGAVFLGQLYIPKLASRTPVG